MSKIIKFLRNSLFYMTPLILSSCGGSLSYDSTTGEKIVFKRDNSFCQISKINSREINIYCTSNGVSTDLVGNRRPFSQKALCWSKWTGEKKNRHLDVEIKEKFYNEDSFPCVVNKDFGQLEKTIKSL